MSSRWKQNDLPDFPQNHDRCLLLLLIREGWKILARWSLLISVLFCGFTSLVKHGFDWHTFQEYFGCLFLQQFNLFLRYSFTRFGWLTTVMTIINSVYFLRCSVSGARLKNDKIVSYGATKNNSMRHYSDGVGKYLSIITAKNFFRDCNYAECLSVLSILLQNSPALQIFCEIFSLEFCIRGPTDRQKSFSPRSRPVTHFQQVSLSSTRRNNKNLF